MADRFEQVRFGGPIGALLAETQERVLAEFVGRSRAVPCSTSAPARGARRWRWRARGATRHRRRRLERDAARRARARRGARAAGHVRAPATRTRCRSTTARSTLAVCLRVLMHTPDWRRCVGELCRVARQRRRARLPGAPERGGAAVGGPRVAAAARARGWRRTACSPSAPSPRAGAPRLPRRRRASAVRAADRAAQAAGLARGSPSGSKRALARAGLLRLLGSPVTVLAERCSVLVTGATGFTGGHLARALARRGHDVRALVRMPADARRSRRAPASSW